MNLDLLAIDFKGTSFCDNENCAVAKAAKRLFPNAKRISELVTDLEVTYKNNKISNYDHELYVFEDYKIDKAKAKKSKSDSEIIRTIKLTKTS